MARGRADIFVYEEYANAAEKRASQTGAKRGIPTGKARGYCFVFACNGRNSSGHWECVAPVLTLEPGSQNVAVMATTGISHGYLRENCRRVGKKYLTGRWKTLLARFEKQ